MSIQRRMIPMKSSYFMFLLILLCASVVESWEYTKTAEEVFLSQLVDPVTGEIDEAMAELLWISCRLDFLHLKEVNEELNLFFLEETYFLGTESESECRSQAKEYIWKIIKIQHPQLKQSLIDCTRKNNIMFPVSGKGGSNIQHTRYLDALFPRPVVSKRNLLQGIAGAPSPAIDSPSPNPVSSQMVPSPNPAPAPSPGKSFFPTLGVNAPPPPLTENVSAGPASGPYVKPHSSKSKHKEIVTAVVVTATVTSAIAALFFYCFMKINRGSPGMRQNDEGPLLSLSLSDSSTGSAYRPFGLVSSIKEEKVGHQSFSNNSSHDKQDSPLDGLKSDNITIGLVPPPPGRLENIPSLKPPPGRADPLPPEPPASLRPPSKAGPAPPPPPWAPPPTPAKASGSTNPFAPPPPAKASGSTNPFAPPHPPPMDPVARTGRPPPPPPVAPVARPGLSPLGANGATPCPPPPGGGPPPPRPPPPLPTGSKVPHPPSGSKLSFNVASGNVDGAPKTKLKPFFWDKVMANPDHSMVWHQIKSGSFQFNEEMIETLFGYVPADQKKTEHKKVSSSQDPSPQNIQILDAKKAQNLSILMRALNVTVEEVCDALYEGNELPSGFIETMLKMAPTEEEELKLRLFNGELSELGPAERFLKVLIDIPFAYKRLEALLFMCTLQEDVTTTKESFKTLEVACNELKNSRLFLKLLEAVLKTGNRMNDGTFRGGAQAFKLDTLLKLSDVKGVDGKTTLLHFVVQEIIRSEGVRAARAAKDGRSFSNVSIKTDDLCKDIPNTEEEYRDLGLQVVSHLSNELENVKKAAAIDADNLTVVVSKLGHVLFKTQDFLDKDMKSLNEGSEFHETLRSFVRKAEVDILTLLDEEKRIMSLVKSTGDYFHGKTGKDEGLRLFAIVRDFLIILDKVCKEVGDEQKRLARLSKRETSSASSHPSPQRQPASNFHSRLFPAIAGQHLGYSSSDDEN